MEGRPKRVDWTHEQLLIAFKLYCELPFGKMHSKNPEIIRIAKAIGRSPGSLAMKLTNIASLDPAIYLTGRKGLTGASQADRTMWDQMTSDWEKFWDDANSASATIKRLLPDAQAEAEGALEQVSYEGQTREAITKVRIGQALFRESVLSAYDYKCCISGIESRKLLVASHIVPWRSAPKNRLNPSNGLCLSAIHDRAFDCGLITFAEDFTLILSKQLRTKANQFFSATFLAYEGRSISLPEKFLPNPEFLSFHRNEVFLK